MAREQVHRYRVVDVFTEQPLEGNPLAVFPDTPAPDAVTMQRIARELNLAETVFVVRPTREDCIARLRIFTPSKEMRFAGHPTIGAAFVLLDEGVAPAAGSFFVEEEVGPVAVRVESGASPTTLFQMDQTALADQALLRHIRERREDLSLDRGWHVRARRHHSKAAQLVAVAADDASNPKRHAAGKALSLATLT